MSVANKGPLDLQAHMECEKHKNAVRGEMSLAKVTNFFTASGNKTDEAVLAEQGALLFCTIIKTTTDN